MKGWQQMYRVIDTLLNSPLHAHPYRVGLAYVVTDSTNAEWGRFMLYGDARAFCGLLNAGPTLSPYSPDKAAQVTRARLSDVAS